MTCKYRDPSRPTLLRCTECGRPDSLCSCPMPDQHANFRLHSREGQILSQVLSLLEEAPEQRSTHPLADLVSAVGDAHRYLSRHDQLSRGNLRDSSPHEGSSTASDIGRTLVRVAAYAILLTARGDPDYAYDPDALFE